MMLQKADVVVSPRFFSRLCFLLFWILLVFPVSCIKVIEPKVEGLYLADFHLNDNGEVEALLVIKIHNSNDFDIDITIKDLRHYQEGELVGSLTKEERILLKSEESTTFSITVELKKKSLLNSILSLFTRQDIEITIQGELIVHHWTGDREIKLDKTFNLNLKNLLGQ